MPNLLLTCSNRTSIDISSSSFESGLPVDAHVIIPDTQNRCTGVRPFDISGDVYFHIKAQQY